ncbi:MULTISPECIES: 23S rRNA (guanosine(2251)-2'-O)-methyltransferase RlmB [Bacillus]|uniref:tRNA/rRNA methyltransferase YacO n=1 Tax=Bacillus licheniformis (strain ATCC 14580 / DSM 13 / JCM 2505 / CCUG 7422 / NBRC 12200 / NCIMB 9375 / NCTC 10341 / NRRL NRS-1264 / Gibson 46) TaxID=279010 RepID=Q65PC6_BACLD|nr:MULTISPECIES: 23S rRNA (guanosine(2251)-2'-O)-methyltransferase RlmB [Bacillus]AAU21744.1 putative tRNA/rRNA methyltransferase YacO [Bacillus licheniformis DSM 13 = ATCC 14580]AAU39088.1 putative TrmH-family tRNA/rRNA methyltransferase YacO [Bacillus licheniformis DSM 13 = ATCC 14580]MBG9697069.1 RNA methyltransferase TrmH [Bacillus licheniformis]MCR3919863.1 23S rRNA (guanosine(2251)-2'-O)-methyltransferase RlmB [Bacillus licheniformis]MCZ0108465.1 23S rRNA (guanosine(2251)-2'-O)-methyltra
MSQQHDYVIGKNAVIETLKSGRELYKLWMAENTVKGQAQQVVDLAAKNGVTIHYVPRKKLDQMVSGQHQGVVAQVAAYEYAELDDLFQKAEDRNEQPFILVLDEIEDPHNLGSIMRTADAVGAHGIVIPKRRAVGLTTTVAKASTGAIEHIPVVKVTNLSRTLEEMKGRGIWVVGTDASGQQDYRSLDGNMPLALVIGSEGKGMGRLVKEKCDFLIRLPMAGKVTSLNASVAAGLLMYEVYRKRSPLGE